MGAAAGPNIVEDGLVLALDAGNTKSLVNGEGDPSFSNVSLLLNGDGTNGSTNIVDSSSNNNTITVNGTAEISTAQSKFGGSSLYFTQAAKDTAQNYLSLGSAISISGTEDFAIEFWAYKSSSGTYDGVLSNNSGGDNFIELSTARGLVVYIGGGGNSITAETAFGTGGSYADSTWHHYAVTRENNTRRIFIDGDLKITVPNANNAVTLSLVGTIRTTRYSFEGYLEDIRITKGVARYTSNFTPPTTALPGEASQWNDTSGNGNSGTIKNNTEVSYYNSANGGSLVFDGTDDYIELPASSDLNFGTGNFTIEGWFNKGATTTNLTLLCSNKYYTNGYNGNWILRISSATQIALATYDGTGNLEYNEFSASTSVNTWHHFALVREGTGTNETKFYLDGVLKGSMTVSKSLTDAGTNGLRIGEENDGGPGNAPFNGKISNVKLYKGKALTSSEVKQNYNALRGRYGI